MPSWFEGGTYPESILISLLRNTWGILEKYYEVVLLRNRYKIIQLFFWEYFLLYLFQLKYTSKALYQILFTMNFTLCILKISLKSIISRIVITKIINTSYFYHYVNMETIISLFLMLINLEFIHCHAMSFNLKLNNGCAKNWHS